MPTTKITIERFNIISSKPFADVLARVDGAIGHPDSAAFARMSSSLGDEEFRKAVTDATGPSGLLEFHRFDLGASIAKDPALKAFPLVRIVAGNPLIMREMASRVPDAGSYAPITILVSQREDGVHLSYDLMASDLATYGNERALEVARALDAKVIKLLTEAAG